jgi:hypothetical protein
MLDEPPLIVMMCGLGSSVAFFIVFAFAVVLLPFYSALMLTALLSKCAGRKQLAATEWQPITHDSVNGRKRP